MIAVRPIIVICDDEAVWRSHHCTIINAVLEELQIEADVHVFEDGTGALEFLSQKDNPAPVILITDGEMRLMRGYALLANLRQIDKFPLCAAICTQAGFKEVNQELSKVHMLGDKITHLPKKHAETNVVDFLITSLGKIELAEQSCSNRGEKITVSTADLA
jgi:CheY-like chemotaxis protein